MTARIFPKATNGIEGKHFDYLENGTADPDVEIPKMRGELEAAGIDELIADIQSEPDAHLAATK